MTGMALSQVIGLLAIPIISRLFTPVDYGIFNIFLGIVTIAGVLVTFKYEQILVLPKRKKDAINIVVLAFMITFIISALSLIIVLIAPKTLGKIINTEGFSQWLIYIPISIFLVGIFQILEKYSLRRKDYKKLRTGHISQSLTRASINIGLGFYQKIMGGLIWGYIAGQVIAVLFLSRGRLKSLFFNIRKHFDWQHCKAMARKYRKTTFALIPSSITGSLTTYVPIFVLGFIYDDFVVGIYSMGFNVVNLPILILGKALYDVSYKHSIDIINSNNSLSEFVERIVARLSIIGIAPVVFLGLFAKPFFNFLLGEEWQLMALYIQILLPYFFFKFVCIPVMILIQTGKAHIYLYWQILYLILTCIALLTGKFLLLSHELTILLLSISNTLCYILLLYLNFKVSGAKLKNVFREIKGLFTNSVKLIVNSK